MLFIMILFICKPVIFQSLVHYREPNTYEEAAPKPEWQEAMQKEFETLQKQITLGS